MPNRAKAILAVWGFLPLAAIVYAGFNMLHFDYGGMVWLAEEMSISSMARWHNGFFPFGAFVYAKAFGFGKPILAASVSVMLFWFLLYELYGMAKFFTKTKQAVWFAIAVTALPYFLRHFVLLNPDVFSLVFIVAAVNRWLANKRLWVVALLLGVACWFRYHALVLSIPLLVFMVFEHKERTKWLALGSFLIGISLLVIISWAETGKAFSTLNFANVYQSYFPINGVEVDGKHAAKSLDFWFNNADFILSKYLSYWLKNWWLALALMASAALSFKSQNARLKVISILAIFYYLVVMLAPSPNMYALAWPLVLIPIFSSSTLKLGPIKLRVQYATMALAVIGVYTFVEFAWQQKELKKVDAGIEQSIEKESQNEPVTVFCYGHDFYARKHKNWKIAQQNGWMRMNEPLYNARLPSINFNGNTSEVLSQFSANNYGYVVIDSRLANRYSAIFASHHFQKIGEHVKRHIYIKNLIPSIKEYSCLVYKFTP
ncbi:MAG: hypothetical protein KDC92_04670 [Bacteroidetes bacterium]|nr:hypothetical protein [Bacteroidota bacterium]